MDQVSRALLMANSGQDDYWVLELTPGTTLSSTTQVSADSSANIVVANGYGSSSPFIGVIAKVSPSGALSWSTRTTNASSDLRSLSGRPCFDSSDNIYLPLGFSLYSLTSAGAKSSEYVNSNNFLPNDYAQDGDTLYVAGYTAVANPTSVLAKLTTSALQWTAGSTTVNADRYYCVETSTSNVFASGIVNGTTTYHVAKHAKSNGARLATRYSTDTNLTFMAVDSSENVYAVGNRSSASILAKLDSSLVEQWVKSVTSQTLTAIRSDGSYLYTLGSGKYLTKWDLSGNVVYQIEFNKPTFTFNLNNLCITPSGAIVIAGTVVNGATTCMLLMKLPSNGGVTGTFGSYTFTSTSPTVTTPAASATTADPSTSTTPSLSLSNGGNGATSYSLTSALQGL